MRDNPYISEVMIIPKGSGGGGRPGRSGGGGITPPDGMEHINPKEFSKDDVEWKIRRSDKQIRFAKSDLETMPGKLNEMVLKGHQEEKKYWETVLAKKAYRI